MFRVLVFVTAACALVQGCGSAHRESESSTAAAGSPSPTTEATTATSAGIPAAQPPMHVASVPVAGAAAGSGGSAVATMPTHVAVAGAGAAGTGGADAGAATGKERMPCDVAAVFQHQCHSCHGETLNLGAPMPLVTWADLHAPAVSDSSKKVFEMVAIRVQDTMRPMPPKMNGTLAAADHMLLVSWSDQGAPALAADAADCP